ncbi:pyridoxamine 5'-phosphate oxidase family protein [Bradyrhizobium sp. LTSPM299]|uniref:pyridoxamine 5'-phosphate oxidase family protein n=1 Tax=Bradyrhizobium sp. LTSPM299 TaxID=1619233 RepID=UPI0009E225EF|nr:pyridoxamine 5'-phosphate oxidase family protein [Bradyrhizobium sp. LTSPM299]
MTRAEFLAFLRKHRLAVVSTVHDGAPQAAVVGIAVTDELEIIFDTLTTSRKFTNLRSGLAHAGDRHRQQRQHDHRRHQLQRDLRLFQPLRDLV